MRIRKHLNLEHIHIIKKPGASMRDSYLDEGFLLDKKIGVGQPKRIVNAKIMVANTSMDTDKIKVGCPPFGCVQGLNGVVSQCGVVSMSGPMVPPQC